MKTSETRSASIKAWWEKLRQNPKLYQRREKRRIKSFKAYCVKKRERGNIWRSNKPLSLKSALFNHIIIVFLFSATQAFATIYPSNGSSQNIQALINQAHDGDTITVPKGTHNWTTPIVLSKAITLQGVGSGVLIEHIPNHVIRWQSQPAGYQGPCPIEVELTTHNATTSPSTAIKHAAGSATLITFQNAGAIIVGMRFTQPAGVTGYIVREQPFSAQDCWFRNLNH